MPQNIIVRRSALATGADPYDLVECVIDFVSAMIETGLFSRSEILDKALQAYHANRYIAEVDNGGHSQFIHNCHEELNQIVSDVRLALAGMNAKEHLAIFDAMAAWLGENPAEAEGQTGFEGGRALLLDELDTRFYKADKATPLVVASARWIASWPELNVVDDAAYNDAIQKTCLTNPHRDARQLWVSVRGIDEQVSDLFYVGVGLACAQANPGEVKQGIGGGWFTEVDGASQMSYVVRTSANVPRQVIFPDTHAALYEFIKDDKSFMRGRVGRKLSHVTRETIERMAKFGVERDAAVAIDLLLRKSGVDPLGAAVTPKSISSVSNDTRADWFVNVKDETLLVRALPGGFALSQFVGNDPVVTVNSQEIAKHAARVAAGEFK